MSVLFIHRTTARKSLGVSCDAQAIAVVFQQDGGRVSFFDEQQSRAILGALLERAVTIDAHGAVVASGGMSAESFYAVVQRLGGLVLYEPAQPLLDELGLVRDYFESVRRGKLKERYGRPADIMTRPRLAGLVESGAWQPDLQFILENCRAICVWAGLTGAERIPVFLGDGAEDIACTAKEVASDLSVAVSMVDDAGQLPAW